MVLIRVEEGKINDTVPGISRENPMGTDITAVTNNEDLPREMEAGGKAQIEFNKVHDCCILNICFHTKLRH